MKPVSKAPLAAALLVLLIVLGAGVTTADARTKGSTSTSTSESSTSTIQNHCTNPSNEASGITCSWLKKQAKDWKPAVNASIGWSAYDTGASYDYEENAPASQIDSELSMLVTSGASCIRVDIGYDPWLLGNETAQSEMIALANAIRSDGKCLILGDASAEYYRTHPLNWSQFQAAWIERVETLASLFQPNFYAVVNEPGWYAPMVSDASTNPQFTNVSVWDELTGNLVSAVHDASPQTKVGVEIQGGSALSSDSAFYVDYLKAVSAMPGIDFIGYDLYGASDMLNALTVESQVQTTKNIWIAQTWTDPTAAVAFNSNRENLDATWVQVLYYYGLKMHASNLEPFFTDLFASYTCGEFNSAGDCMGQAESYSARTPVFYEYQHLAEAYGTAVE